MCICNLAAKPAYDLDISGSWRLCPTQLNTLLHAGMNNLKAYNIAQSPQRTPVTICGKPTPYHTNKHAILRKIFAFDRSQDLSTLTAFKISSSDHPGPPGTMSLQTSSTMRFSGSRMLQFGLCSSLIQLKSSTWSYIFCVGSSWGRLCFSTLICHTDAGHWWYLHKSLVISRTRFANSLR